MSKFEQVVTFLCVCALSFTCGYTSSEVKKDLALKASEDACIADFVASGFERKDIKRDNGTCYWVEPL